MRELNVRRIASRFHNLKDIRSLPMLKEGLRIGTNESVVWYTTEAGGARMTLHDEDPNTLQPSDGQFP
ncbi:MAG: hypothetical protein JNK85_11620 [Verrucomicrobiales bacterium]|nr:hypothetical protein [Verrucomicrobiales bacterium]